MTSFRRMSMATLAIMVMSASVAIAQPAGGRGGQGPHGPPPGGHGGPGDAVLQALDADGNQEISAEEISNAPAALRSLDSNGDGILSEKDRNEANGRHAEHRGQHAGNSNRRGERQKTEGNGRRAGNRQRGQGGPGGGRQGGPPSPEQFVSRAMEFDADNDGMLSESELTSFAKQMGPPGGGRHGGGGKDRQQRPDRPSRPDSD